MASLPLPMGGPPPMPPGPPGGTGAAMVPGPMPGATASGMAGVKTGLEALQKALPTLPMGSDLHSSVLKAVTEISKHMGDASLPQPGHEDMVQQLAQLARAGPQMAPPGFPPAAPPPAATPAPPPPGL